jgi:bifunctional pyridoxal-dependent enzyme with beta-cystathionase and maltose regulon repressor activities
VAERCIVPTIFDLSLKDAVQRRMPARKWRKYGQDVIPLWIADHDFAPPEEVRQAIREALDTGDTGYTVSSEVLQLMAEKVTKKNEIPASPTDVYVTQGVLPVIWLACKFACKPGDEGVVTDPMYYPFFESARAAEVKMKYVRLDSQEGYRFEDERFKEAITPRTKLIFVCNPHNPTGRVMTRDELSCIADIADDHNLMVMSDELWEDILFDGRRHTSIASLNSSIGDRTITAFGFSKTFGVAGLQIGYAVVTNKVMMRKIKSIGIRDTGNPDEPALRGTGSLSLAAARIMLSGRVDYYVRELVAYLQKVRDEAYQRLSKMELVRSTPLEGTYLMFPNISDYGMSSNQLTAHLLDKARVAVESGSEFGPAGEGHVRINIGTSIEILNEALIRIESALKRTKS